jgi:hypothetical protein
MKKEAIIQLLKEQYQKFVDSIRVLPENEFMLSVNNKWTAGQQLDHVSRAVRPVVLGLYLPKFVFKLFFGKANRPSRTYDELVEKYLGKLSSPYKISKAFVPKGIGYGQKEKLANTLMRNIDQLCKQLDRLTEEQLDHYILPHPLLGKITLREMMYFTIYHAGHHRKQVVKKE